MNPLQEPHGKPGIRERLTQWRLPLTLLCLTVAVLAFLWALPGRPFRSVVASSQNSTTPRTKPIEQLVPGDLVLARDPESGKTRAKKVLRVFRNVSDHLRLLTVRNADGTSQMLRTTDGHPFWVPNRGWVAAGELKIGQELVQADGQPATLVETVYEAHPEGVPIFNFEVEGFHTYFVAAHGTRAPPIFVHNTSPTTPTPPDNGPPPYPEGTPLPNNEIIVVMGGKKPGTFQTRPGIDDRPTGSVTEPGKSGSIAQNLEPATEIPQAFPREPRSGDILLGTSVADMRAAGFDVVAAVKNEKDFLKGFLPHFEALVGFGSQFFKERERN